MKHLLLAIVLTLFLATSAAAQHEDDGKKKKPGHGGNGGQPTAWIVTCDFGGKTQNFLSKDVQGIRKGIRACVASGGHPSGVRVVRKGK